MNESEADKESMGGSVNDIQEELVEEAVVDEELALIERRLRELQRRKSVMEERRLLRS